MCFVKSLDYYNNMCGSIDKDEAAQMEAALAECRKVDEISVEKM